MGYPKCTREAIAQAVKYRKNGMSNKDIAACIGICERTFYKWLNDPKSENQRQLGQELKSAEAEFKAALRSKIIKASDDSWQAAAWMLERGYPEEYSRKYLDANLRGNVKVESISPSARAEMDRLLGIDGD